MGLLDGDFGTLGASLLAQQSPYAGVNIGQALLQAQQLQLRQQQQVLAARMQQQQLEAGGIDLQQKKQAADDQEQLRRAMQSQEQSGLQTIPGGSGVGMAPSGNSKSAYFQQISAKADQLEKLGSPQALVLAKQYRELAEKYRPELKDTKTLTDPNTGQRVTVNFYKDGTQEVVPFAPDKEKAHFMDVGSGIMPVDPFSGKPVGNAYIKSVTPDQLLQSNTTMRGQNMTDSRARDLNAITQQGQQTQVLNDPNQGPMLVNKRDATARPVTMNGQPVQSENAAKQTRGAKNVLQLLDEAEKYLPQATGSYAGRGLDFAARGFGQSTEGDRATASLQAIEGSLLSAMPRMEGPQSNYDVQNYKRAAGMIGDATVPREIRKQAIDTIREIQQKYAGGQPTATASGFKYLGKE